MIKRFLIAVLLCLPVLAHAETMVVVAAKSSSLSSLSMAEAQQVFSGQLRSLNGASVQTVDLPSGNDMRNLFYQKLLGRSPDQMRSHWARLIFTGKARPPRETSGTTEVLSVVGASDYILGYVPESAVNDRVKVLMLVE